MIEAAAIIHRQGLADRVEIVGVDLVGMFLRTDANDELTCLTLIEASLTDWEPRGEFDVITCVHGLHYVGDKVGLICRAAAWQARDGIFAANLDLNNLRFGNGRPAGRIAATELRKAGMTYNARCKLLACDGRRDVKLSLRFLGANDQAGPNYTGQEAVDSYYEPTPARVMEFSQSSECR